MTQDFKTRGDSPGRAPESVASPVDSPEQAADTAGETNAAGEAPTYRVGESGVGAQRDDTAEFDTPAGDGNYEKTGDRQVSISGEDDVQR